jgi:hypothetical protein
VSYRNSWISAAKSDFQGQMSCRKCKTVYFYSVDSSFSNDHSERPENNFEKWYKDFVSKKSNNNNLSQVSYRCHILGESNSSLSPNFWISEFTCLTHVSEMQIPGK